MEHLRCANTVHISKAIARFVRGAESDFAISYSSSEAHGFAKDTHDRYSTASQRLAVRLRT